MVAGVRAKGPLRSAEDSHAVVEWAGQPGEEAVRNMINDRVPFGILEMKSAWATDDPDRSPGITTAMARIAFPHDGCYSTFNFAWPQPRPTH